MPVLRFPPELAAEAADILLARRRHGLLGPCLPEALQPHDLDEAWRIQCAVRDRLVDAGDAVAGWKCGIPTMDRWVLAPIHQRATFDGDTCVAWTEAGGVRVEPELAFVLGHDLPARPEPYAAAEVDAVVVATRLALEVIHNRYQPGAAPTVLEKLADGLVSGGLVLGPEVDARQARAASTLAITVDIEGRAPQTLEGMHPDGDPRLPLYDLVERLRLQGEGLKAGQVVITGSYAGSVVWPVDRRIRVHFGDLGTLAITFQAREA